MFQKSILVVLVMLATKAFASSPAGPVTLRGGWICQATPEEGLSLNVDVRYIPIGPSGSDRMDAIGRHRIRIMSEHQEVLVIDAAEVGVQEDRTIYKGDADEGSAELTIANSNDPKLQVPSLLYISRIERPADTRIPVASLIELLCTRTRAL
jgi:hypothetical protein